MAGMTADLRDENADGEFLCHFHVISHAHVDSDSRAPGEPPVYFTLGRRTRGLLVKVLGARVSGDAPRRFTLPPARSSHLPGYGNSPPASFGKDLL